MKKFFASFALMMILLLPFTAFSGCAKNTPHPNETIQNTYEKSDLSQAKDGNTEETEGLNAGGTEGNEVEPKREQSEETPPLMLNLTEDPTPPYRYDAPTSDREGYLAACATTNVNVRRGAGTGYGVLFTLGIGDSLPYLWREGEWIAVWTGERVGYLSDSYAYVTETNLGIERTIRAGLAKLGTPYEWGATRRITGSGLLNPFFTGKSFDCSSFVQYCYYIGMGIKLGNYTGSQADYTVGEKLTRYEDLKRGDFYFTGTDGTISHVVIYLGGGRLLQAYSANGGPVSVTADERWKSHFISGRRPDPTVIEQFR